jgi:hypothetical protein
MFLANKLNKGAGAPPATPDPQFNYVTMLLHGDGTNGAQNNTFLDSSTNNFTITRNGNTTQGSFSPYGSNWSNFFGTANGNALLFTELTLSSDFTIETWIYPTAQSSSGYSIVFSASSSAEQIMYYYTDGSIGCYFANGANGLSSTGKLSMNVWSHVAVVRSGSTVKIYVNGVDTGVSISGSSTVTVGTISGYTTGSGYNVYGYLSNVRIGTTAVYTSNFTPPTAPLTAITGTLLLTCQSNRYVDNSTSARAITTLGAPSVQRFNPFGASTAYSTSVIGGSGYFDGAGDSLIVGNPSVNSQLALGSNDFTIQAWVYPQGTGIYTILGSLNNSNGNGSYWLMVNGTFSGGGTIQFGYNFVLGGSGGNDVLFGTGTLPVNAWSFVAVTRSGSNLRGYVNGVQVGTTNTSIGSRTIYPTNQNLYVGRNVDSDAYAMNGYLSDVQLVNGTALYTGTTMTVPTAPLTAITNTALLCNMTNGAIFDNAMMNNLETVGNAQISTSVVKYGTGSLKFDGAGDRLFEPSNQNFNFGTGDFTIELWVNPINQGGHGSANNDCLIDFRPATNGIYGTLFLYNSGAGLYWEVNGTVRISGGAISNSVWTHIAICRASGSTKLFINGTQSGSTYTDSNNYLVAPITIGEMNDGFGDGNFNGYIDDLRITKGYARYTATFTPPTAAFPNIGPV